jgi:hypothetical protein
MNPACAATKRSADSLASVIQTYPWRSGPGNPCAKRSMSVAFIVFPSSGAMWNSMYRSRIPVAVNASDSAMYVIVLRAVCTFGSRMIWRPFETASMPV